MRDDAKIVHYHRVYRHSSALPQWDAPMAQSWRDSSQCAQKSPAPAVNYMVNPPGTHGGRCQLVRDPHSSSTHHQTSGRRLRITILCKEVGRIWSFTQMLPTSLHVSHSNTSFQRALFLKKLLIQRESPRVWSRCHGMPEAGDGTGEFGKQPH